MITDDTRLAAEERMQDTLQRHPRAVRARYDRWRSRIVIRLDTGLDLALPKRLVQGLIHATDSELSDIEITPTGLGLHWPRLDADLYVPALLDGAFGPRARMASWSQGGDAKVSKRSA